MIYFLVRLLRVIRQELAMFDTSLILASNSSSLVPFLNMPCCSSTDIQRNVKHRGITYNAWKYVNAVNNTSKIVRYILIGNTLSNNDKKSRRK